MTGDENHSRAKDLAGVPFASSSQGNVDGLGPSSDFLSIPAPKNRLSRRPSIESAFSGSDISELSFASTEIGGAPNEGLIRTLSNASSQIANFPPPSTWRTKLQEFWIANYGAFLVLLSQMFGCMMNISTRLLETPGSHGAPMHPFQILFVRQSVTVLITTTYALWSKSVPHFPLGPPGRVRLLLACRGVFGFLGVFGLYFSLLYLPISEATILTFLGPIGTCYAFSLLIPGEIFSRQQQMAGVLSLVGVIFIARPFSFFNNDPPGTVSGIDSGLSANSTIAEVESSSRPTPSQHIQAVGVAMVGVLGAIGAMTSIRVIGTRAHALLSVNYFSAWCTFVSLVAMLVVPSVKFRPPGNVTEWGLLSILGFAGFVMQLLLTKGLAYGSPSNVERQPAPSQDDMEMQARSVEPQAGANVSTGITSESQGHGRLREPKQIKSSGAKATSMMYTQMLFALVSDKVVFGITPGVWSWVGSGLILFAAFWVAAEGSKKPANTPATSSGPRSDLPRQGKGRTAAAHEEQVGLLTDHDELHHTEATSS